MKVSETPMIDGTKDWLSPIIRVIGIAFIIGGLWGFGGAIMHVPHFSILATFFSVTIDLAGIAFIVAGYNLALRREDGRKLALFLTYSNLGVLLVLSLLVMGQGQAIDQFTLLEYRPDNLLVPILVLIPRSILEIGLILFLSSRKTKALFADGN